MNMSLMPVNNKKNFINLPVFHENWKGRYLCVECTLCRHIFNTPYTPRKLEIKSDKKS